MESSGQKPQDHISSNIELQGQRRETIRIYNQLMDRMEKSVPENGNFFVRLGGPSDNWGEKVLILKEGIKKTDIPDRVMADYVVIATDGPRIITVDENMFMQEFVPAKPQEGHFERDQLSERVVVNGRSFDARPVKESERDLVNNAMAKSIKVAKEESIVAKNEAALKEEQVKQNIARDLWKTLDATKLPPSPQDEARRRIVDALDDDTLRGLAGS